MFHPQKSCSYWASDTWKLYLSNDRKIRLISYLILTTPRSHPFRSRLGTGVLDSCMCTNMPFGRQPLLFVQWLLCISTCCATKWGWFEGMFWGCNLVTMSWISYISFWWNSPPMSVLVFQVRKVICSTAIWHLHYLMAVFMVPRKVILELKVPSQSFKTHLLGKKTGAEKDKPALWGLKPTQTNALCSLCWRQGSR